MIPKFVFSAQTSLFGSSCKYPTSCGTSLHIHSQHLQLKVFEMSTFPTYLLSYIPSLSYWNHHVFNYLRPENWDSSFLSCSISLLFTPPHPTVVCAMVSTPACTSGIRFHTITLLIQMPIISLSDYCISLLNGLPSSSLFSFLIHAMPPWCVDVTIFKTLQRPLDVLR